MPDFKELKVIDWSAKGNVVRLYLGYPDCDGYWGDDWDDAPYEHNAGNVYDEYIVGFMDVAVGIGYDVTCPSDLYLNSPYSKADFKAGVPFAVISPCDDLLYGYDVYGDPSDYGWDDRVRDASVLFSMGMTVDGVLSLCEGGIVSAIGSYMYYGGAVPASEAPDGAIPVYDVGSFLLHVEDRARLGVTRKTSPPTAQSHPCRLAGR